MPTSTAAIATTAGRIAGIARQKTNNAANTATNAANETATHVRGHDPDRVVRGG